MSEEKRSPSEEVRAKLDELSIGWVAISENTTVYTQEGIVYMAYEMYGGLQVAIVTPVTPEQAIAATVGRRDTMELWPEWEQVLFANVSDEVAQDNLNECVHELLDKAATVGRSCASCPEADNPDSYISHLQSALRWHDEHVPRPTNPRNTCVVLKGVRAPEEVLFVREDGEVTHYLPEGTADQQDEIDRLKAENAKLREYAESYLAAVDLDCDLCPYCDPELCDTETDPMREGCRLWEEMRELGIEV